MFFHLAKVIEGLISVGCLQIEHEHEIRQFHFFQAYCHTGMM